jgi:ElaB/YqjD/DUF883 family membrane-anchored ribosome-binding protein
MVRWGAFDVARVLLCAFADPWYFQKSAQVHAPVQQLDPPLMTRRGTGMERLRDLMQDQWLPELKELNKEFDEVMEKKRANSHGSSRTKQARQEEANKALENIEERCKRIQDLYYECLVKIIRAQPVRARMLASNVLYNCNAKLDCQKAKEKAEQASLH